MEQDAGLDRDVEALRLAEEGFDRDPVSWSTAKRFKGQNVVLAGSEDASASVPPTRRGAVQLRPNDGVSPPIGVY